MSTTAVSPITTRPESLAMIASIIEQLTDRNRAAKHLSASLDNIDAEFFQRGRKRPIGSLSVTEALDSLANDVHYFAEFDIHDADRVELRTY